MALVECPHCGKPYVQKTFTVLGTTDTKMVSQCNCIDDIAEKERLIN